MARVYLSRRNLLTFLSKLDRVKAGQESACAIEKYDQAHPQFPQTMEKIAVVAVEDTDLYIPPKAPQVNLSRQSIVTLLSYLDEIKAGHTADSTMEIDCLEVVAVEDAAYYTYRPAGEVLPIDDPDSRQV